MVLILSSCVMPNDIDKKIVIKYYGKFNHADVWLNHNEKHTFSEPIPKDHVQQVIDNLPGDPWISVFKVYFKNKTMYKQGIPLKAEQYQAPIEGFAQVWEYDKLGRVSKFITLYNEDNYITEYKYKPNEKIVTKTRNKRAHYHSYTEKKEHFFYDDKECLIKRVLYYDGKLDSIEQTNKRDLISCRQSFSDMHNKSQPTLK
jgi:hypothetical protein